MFYSVQYTNLLKLEAWLLLTFFLCLHNQLSSITVADWDSMGRVVTQTHDRVFQTLGRAFQTLGRAFDLLLRLQNFKNLAKRLKGPPCVLKQELGRVVR